MTNKAIREIKLWWKKHEEKLFSIVCVLTIIVWLINLLIMCFNYIQLKYYG